MYICLVGLIRNNRHLGNLWNLHIKINVISSVHPILEVRTRALRALQLKINSRLICVADLAQDEDLLANLLEWLNLPDPSMHLEVMGFLHQFLVVSTNIALCFNHRTSPDYYHFISSIYNNKQTSENETHQLRGCWLGTHAALFNSIQLR